MKNPHLNPIKFPQANCVSGQNQEGVMPLHCHHTKDSEQVIFCWSIDDEQLAEIAKTRKVWHHVWTFGARLQPQALSVQDPFPEEIGDIPQKENILVWVDLEDGDEPVACIGYVWNGEWKIGVDGEEPLGPVVGWSKIPENPFAK